MEHPEQSDTLITIGKSFQELKRTTRIIAKERGVAKEAERIIRDILRDVDRMEILEASNAEYRRSGKRLPKDLKRNLSEKYHFSEKDIERLVYSNCGD